MPTSVHIPKELLAAVEERAKALKISRNRFIVRALEKEIAARDQWSPGFFEQLAENGPRDADAVREMMAAIEAARASKGPIEL